VEAGGHEGGHTEYFFDITKLVKPGQNTISVELDNRPTDQSIPGLALKLKPGKNIWYDWWHYGGIVRDVWLAMSDDVVVRRQQIRSEVNDGTAKVHDDAYLENLGSKPEKLSVVAKLYAPNGTLLDTKSQSATRRCRKASSSYRLRHSQGSTLGSDHANLYSIHTR
jgi:beta-glucuronidase